MTTAKSLTAGIAATALVGAIGFAYAQSSNDSTQQAPADATQTQQTPVAGAGAEPVDDAGLVAEHDTERQQRGHAEHFAVDDRSELEQLAELVDHTVEQRLEHA